MLLIKWCTIFVFKLRNMTNQQFNTGVIIARFQTPYLHQGHQELINKVKEKHNKVLIILGVVPLLGSRRNPFDFLTREQMIKKSYPDIVVLPIKDHPSDEQWSINLDRLLMDTFPNQGFILYGSRDSFLPYYSGQFETIALPKEGDFNASDLRQELADKVHTSEDFRAGIIYANYNRYDAVYPTVDMAVFREGKTELLLGQKAIEVQWRFIGGFADPSDSSFEAAALREMREEAGDIEVENVQYELSCLVDDWRFRKEADKIITTLFSVDYVSGVHKANDDIARLQWFKVADLSKMLETKQVVYEHIPLVQHLIQKYSG